MSDKVIYSIPARFRRIENLHILLWLVKDISWALNYRTIGVVMIVPTIIAALVITWQTRRIFSELVHNLAVVFWITANCSWMVGEFYGIDAGTYGLRNLAIIPFSIGLLILVVYYVLYYTRKSVRQKVMQQADAAIAEELQLEESRYHPDAVRNQA